MKNFIKKIVYWILEAEARVVLRKFNPKIVAVTGNVGKTSTKEAIYTIFKNFYSVRKSEKSYNSEIGVPLTILNLKTGWNNPLSWILNIIEGFFVPIFARNYPEWLILEIGADRPGDIKKIAHWLKTDVVVLTRVAEIPTHIEFFKDHKEVVGEKANLIKTLKKDGVLVLNFDDKEIIALRGKTGKKVVSYGFGEGASLRASNYQMICEGAGNIPEGINLKVDYEGSNMPVRIHGMLGMQSAYVALAALAVGSTQSLNFIEMLEAMKKYEGAPGRFRILHGINGTTIIDDTYNSSPVALESALVALSEIKCSGRKIAVLGDMLELGRHSEAAHRKIGEMIPYICSQLIISGMRAKGFEEGAISKGMSSDKIFSFGNSVETAKFIKDFVREGDIILVKGSQGMRMEKVVYEIMLDKECADKLIVRQEKEWLAR